MGKNVIMVGARRVYYWNLKRGTVESRIPLKKDIY
jgi:hypothetical protein